MSYIGTVINSSPTIAARAGTDIRAGSYLAAALDHDGRVVIAGNNGAPIGILSAETSDRDAGDNLYVQVKDIGLWKTGAAADVGALLASDQNGKAVPAAPGAFILAAALEAADGPDQVISVQICKAGFMPAAI